MIERGTPEQRFYVGFRLGVEAVLYSTSLVGETDPHMQAGFQLGVCTAYHIKRGTQPTETDHKEHMARLTAAMEATA